LCSPEILSTDGYGSFCVSFRIQFRDREMRLRNCGGQTANLHSGQPQFCASVCVALSFNCGLEFKLRPILNVCDAQQRAAEESGIDASHGEILLIERKEVGIRHCS